MPDVLSIPLTALFNGEQGYSVFRLQDGDYEKIAVELGEKNATAVIVTTGLSEGDIIALTDPTVPQ
jgi:hypothetical protein